LQIQDNSNDLEGGDNFVDIDDMLLDELDLSGVQAAILSNIERPVQLLLELPAENGNARRVRQPPKRSQVTTTEDTTLADEPMQWNRLFRPKGIATSSLY
jgi:hypothetical protein